MTSRETYTNWLAIAVLIVSLLPISMGALTTTLGAGMAFLDWPTSDGENMLLYNMFRDIREGHTDKVAEHGHRLAGALIGLMSIVLVGLAWSDRRKQVRWLSVGLLLGVIGQGLLGGVRVRLESTELAMAHGLFGAAVFALMLVTAAVSHRSWSRLTEFSRNEVSPLPGRLLTNCAVVLPLVVLTQYGLGGLVRHFGRAIPEHLGGVAVVTVLALTTAMLAMQNGRKALRPYAWMLFGSVLLQIGLGVGAWATRFGFNALGYVPVERSPVQLLFRSGHTIGGMLLLATAVLLAYAVIVAGRAATALQPVGAVKPVSAETRSVRVTSSPTGQPVAGGAR